MLTKYKQAFARHEYDIGKFNGNVPRVIDTKDEQPIRSQPFRVPYVQKQALDTKVNKLVAHGILGPTVSPWSSPSILVPRVNEPDDPRFVSDFRKVNAITTPLHWPLPRVDAVTDVLAGCKYFSKLDALKGFFQIPLNDPNDRERSAIQINTKSLEYLRLPMGLRNSAIIFARCMAQMLDGLNYEECLTYLDDIIIPARTWSEHMLRLSHVLERFIQFNMKINLKKSEFGMTTVSYLGYSYSEDGYKPDPNRVSKVKNWPTPTTKRELLSVLGFLNYFRIFIKNYSLTAAKLYDLTKNLNNDDKLDWTDEHENLLRELINKVCSEPILKYPNYDLEFIIRCDSSGFAIGGQLSQKFDGKHEQPVAFFSRSLSDGERKYPTYEREGLAIISSVRAFKYIIAGMKCIVCSDHMPLRTLKTAQHKSDRLHAWALELEQYNLSVKYQPGSSKIHAVADSLSRLPEQSTANVNTLVAFEEKIKDDFETKQSEDPLYKKIMDHLEQKEEFILNEDDFSIPEIYRHMKHNLGRYHLVDSKLYYQSEKGLSLLCIPGKLREEFLRYGHENIFSGHRGVKKTKAILRKRVFWPGFHKDVEIWVKSCIPCQQRKRAPANTKLPLHPLKTPLCQFDRVSFDICGPYPISEDGNKYVIAFCDHWSRFIIACAIPDKSAKTVALAFIKQVILKYGIPMEALSDQAKEFVGEVMSEIVKILNISRKLTSTYRPQTDGVSEKYFATLNDMLSQYVQTSLRSWTEVLPFVVFAYNICEHQSTGLSPFFLLHGYEPMVPWHLAFPVNRRKMQYSELESPSLDLRKNFNDAWVLAKQNLADAQDMYKFHHDKSTSDPGFQEGDAVFLRQPTVQTSKYSKLKFCWEGPYIIKELRGTHNAVLTAHPEKGSHLPQHPCHIHLARCKKGLAGDRLCQDGFLKS